MSVGVVVTFLVNSDDKDMVQRCIGVHMKLLEVGFDGLPVNDVHVTVLPDVVYPRR